MNAVLDSSPVNAWVLLTELIDYRLLSLHDSLRQRLEHLNGLTARVARRRAVPAGVMDRFQRQYLALADLLETHLAWQECELFPACRRCFRRPCRRGSLAEAVELAAAANLGLISQLDRVQACLCDLEWAGRGTLVEELIDGLRELDEELTAYVRLEAEDLFPLARDAAAGRPADEPGRLVAE
jgi:iron-sulfur cluster repair protein YtfE (RIC family)